MNKLGVTKCRALINQHKFHSLLQSRYANALPFALLPIIYDCGFGIIGEWCEVWGSLGLSVNVRGLGQSITVLGGSENL